MYTDNLNGLDSASAKRVTRSTEGLCISYPSDVELPAGTPVKFDSAGKIVAATAADIPVGYVEIAKGAADRNVKNNYVTIHVLGCKEVSGKATANIAANAELKFAGVESVTLKLQFTTAVAGDVVVARATAAASSGADMTKVLLLGAPYVKA